MADSRSPKGRDQRGERRPGSRSPKVRSQRSTDPGRPDSVRPAPVRSDDTRRFSPVLDDSMDIPAVEQTSARQRPVSEPAPARRIGVLAGVWSGARRAFTNRADDPLVTGPGSARIRSLLDARAAEDRPRARFTARMAVLLLVVAILTVMYASSLRAYVQQRDHLQELKAGNETLRQQNAEYSDEISRWDDPAYVTTQAREQLGYLFPGERGFKLIGLDDADSNATLPTRQPPAKKSTPWWSDAWASVELAGHPPKPRRQAPPSTTINGTDADVAKGTSKQ